MTVKELENKHEKLIECLSEGHQWNCKIDVIDGDCTLLNFICIRCGVQKNRRLHGKNHKRIKTILKEALNAA